MQKSHREQECLKLKVESQFAQSHLLDQGQQTQADQRHLQERALALQQETISLLQQQQAIALEREAALQAGRHARELEVQAQLQIAQLDRLRVGDQQELLCMQREHAELQKEKNMLLQDLGVCQDLIREETQRHQQEQAQYAARIQMLQNIAESQMRDNSAGVGDTTFCAVPTSRDGLAPLPFLRSGAADSSNPGLLATYLKPDQHPDSVRLLRAGDLGAKQIKRSSQRKRKASWEK